MSDFSDAIKQFQGSVQEYQIGQAFRDASEQYKQLNSQAQDDFEKRRAYEQMGNQLGLQLAGLGASELQIQTGMQSVMPKNFKDSNDMYKQALLSNSEVGMDKATKLQEFERKNNETLALIKMQGMKDANERKFAIKTSDTYNKYMSAAQKDYNKYTADAFEKMSVLDQMDEAIRTKNPASMPAITDALARIVAGQKGVLSDEDSRKFKEIGGVAQRINDRLNRYFHGNPGKESLKDIQNSFNSVKKTMEKFKSDIARRHTAQFMGMMRHYNTMGDLKSNEIMDEITGNYGNISEPPQQNNQQIINNPSPNFSNSSPMSTIPTDINLSSGLSSGQPIIRRNLMDAEVK